MQKNTLKQISRKRLVAQLDKLFSLYIRLRDVRAFCGICPFPHAADEQKPIQCCFHFVTRSKHILRWDERNAVGACHSCNYRYEFDPHFAIQWYMAARGSDAYAELIRDGNRQAKFRNEDLKRIKSGLEKKISVLGRSERGVIGKKS